MTRQTLLPPRIEAVQTARKADDRTLRLCDSERDAFLASVTLSGLTYEEIANRIGVTKQAVHKWRDEGVPHKRIRAFCNATGTLLVDQYIRLQLARREMERQLRESDRVALIVANERAA